MVELVGWYNVYKSFSKVMVNVLIFGVDHDLRMPYGVFLRLVDPGVEGRDVDVLDLFAWLSHVMKFDGVGSSTEEGVSGLEWFDELKGGEEPLEVCVVFDVLVPLAFPLDLEMVPLLLEKIVFPARGFVNFLQGVICVADGILVALDGEAVGAAVA